MTQNSPSIPEQTIPGLLDHPAPPTFPVVPRPSEGSKLAIVKLLIPEKDLARPVHRLVVLVPDLDVDETQLAQYIWMLASPRRLEVLYLGLCPESILEPRARRRLATLASITRDDWARVSTSLSVGDDWIELVRLNYRPGDLLICHAEQTTSTWGLPVPAKRMGETLAAALQLPIYLLAGFYELPTPRRSSRLPGLVNQLVLIGIVIAFFGLQLLIQRTTQSTGYTLLMSLSVIAEFGLIAIWIRLFN